MKEPLARTAASAPAAAGASPVAMPRDAAVLPVIEEFLRVDKRVAATGGHRLTKHVDTHTESVDEELLSEKVHVERRSIGSVLPTLDAPLPRQDGDTLIVSVVEEIFVKRLVLIEEIRITRTRSAHRHVEQVALRKERIVIERIDEEGNVPTE